MDGFSSICIWMLISSTTAVFHCNYDDPITSSNCLLPFGMYHLLTAEQLGSTSFFDPVAPLSDVTSSLTPTKNGHFCALPYKVDSHNWNMYFCNGGACLTSTNEYAQCQFGLFAYREIGAPVSHSYFLNSALSAFNYINEHCLIYYYYIPTISNITMSITVRKIEVDESESIIDYVDKGQVNGWIRREVNYNAIYPNYQIYFDLSKLPGSSSTSSIIGIDELSITLGICPNGSATQGSTVATTTTISKTTTTISTTSTRTTTISTTSTTTINSIINIATNFTLATTTSSVATTTTTSLIKDPSITNNENKRKISDTQWIIVVSVLSQFWLL